MAKNRLQNQQINDTNMTFSQNIKLLKKYHPKLHQQISEHAQKEIGDIYPHPQNSKYNNITYQTPDNKKIVAYENNPKTIIKKSIQDIPPKSNGLLIIIGLALGYSTLYIIQKRVYLSRIVIIEPSIDGFITALKHTDLSQLINHPNVHFFVGPLPQNQFKKTCQTYAMTQDILIRHHKPSFEWRPDLYKKVHDTVYLILNKFQISGGTSTQIAPLFFENRFQALSLIHHTTPTDALAGIFNNKPAVLIAAGPSLSEDLQYLKEVQGKCIIICADTALSVLLQKEITPDFITSADYSMLSFEKTAPYIGKKMPFCLVTIPKVCPLVLKRLKPKHTFIGFNLDAGQNWLIDILAIQHLLPTISSVAHLSLGLALLMEANPIILLGQDLAFTDPESYHVRGTNLHNKGRQGHSRDDVLKTGVRGTTVWTDRGFLEMKEQFEEIIEKHQNRVINATSRGLKILGTEEMTLQTALKTSIKEDLPINTILQNAVAKHPNYPINELSTSGPKILKDITVVQKLLKQFLGKNKLARKELAKLKHKTILSQTDLPSKTIKTLQTITTLNNTINTYRNIWDPIAEPTFSLQNKIDTWQEENQILLRNKGYLAWLKEEIARFEYAQKNRSKALNLFKNKLEDLLHHLKKETHLIKHQHVTANIPKLAELYISTGDFILAENILNTHPNTEITNSKQKEKYQLLKGAIHAALRPESENVFWTNVARKNTNTEVSKQITKLTHQIATPWLESFKKYGDNPYLAKKCLQRLSYLVPFSPNDILPELLTLWKNTAKEIHTLIQNNNYPEIALKLNTWYPLRKHLPSNWGELNSSFPQEQKTTELSSDELSSKARSLLETGQFEQGLALLSKAVQIDPNQATLWEEIGDLLVAQNDHAGAINAYEKCLEALPNRLVAAKKLAEAHLQIGNIETAKSVLEMAVNLAK